ncbi:ATP-dependent helicase, partial [Escherichia coli]|nr:ATP-dependent helicase [Escherichia coli]
AHELDGRITSVATAEISARALAMAARRADKLGAKRETLEDVIDDFTAAIDLEAPGRWETMSDPARGGFVALRDALWKTRQSIGEP